MPHLYAVLNTYKSDEAIAWVRYGEIQRHPLWSGVLSPEPMLIVTNIQEASLERFIQLLTNSTAYAAPPIRDMPGWVWWWSDSEVQIVQGEAGLYLRSRPNHTRIDNLDELPSFIPLEVQNARRLWALEPTWNVDLFAERVRKILASPRTDLYSDGPFANAIRSLQRHDLRLVPQ